jgi:integrase
MRAGSRQVYYLRLPLPSEFLLPLLGQYLESRTDDVDALFVGLQGRLKKRRIQELFRFYATEADLPADRRHVHVLRHSAAVHVLDAGEDIDFAGDHLGHRSIQSTMTTRRSAM